MTTIYVVTTGTYSDYGIEGVYSTLEQANKVCALLEPDYYGEARVEEYELDFYPGIDREGRNAYVVRFGTAGDVLSISATESFSGYTVSEYKATSQHPAFMAVSVVARDEAHAIKIAADRRGQYLAEKHGIA